MKFLKVLACFFIVFQYQSRVHGQFDTCYIGQPGKITTMSKAEFLQQDSIRTTTKNYFVFSYSAAFTAENSPLWYVSFHGSKIDQQLKEWVKSYDSCYITFDQLEIKEADKIPYNLRYGPLPFVIRIK